MDCIEDDARALSAFTDQTMSAVVDKGLIDSLFLADEHSHIHDIMASVHRVLQPDGTFLIFSLSEPAYLLPQLLLMTDGVTPSSQHCWQPNVDVRELESTFLYRCQKLPEPKKYPVMKKKNKKRGR
jgi:ubiquinone/menaquinone biosynthesis C-methylase UbiE